jgi:hypothetical protein
VLENIEMHPLTKKRAGTAAAEQVHVQDASFLIPLLHNGFSFTITPFSFDLKSVFETGSCVQIQPPQPPA